MPVNINHLTSQETAQEIQRSKGQGHVETFPRIPSLKSCWYTQGRCLNTLTYLYLNIFNLQGNGEVEFWKMWRGAQLSKKANALVNTILLFPVLMKKWILESLKSVLLIALHEFFWRNCMRSFLWGFQIIAAIFLTILWWKKQNCKSCLQKHIGTKAHYQLCLNIAIVYPCFSRATTRPNRFTKRRAVRNSIRGWQKQSPLKDTKTLCINKHDCLVL